MKKFLWIFLILVIAAVAYAASGVFVVKPGTYTLVVVDYPIYSGKTHRVFTGKFGWAPRFFSKKVVFETSFSAMSMKFTPVSADSTPLNVSLTVSLRVPPSKAYDVFRRFGIGWKNGVKVSIKEVLQKLFDNVSISSGINTLMLSESLKRSINSLGVEVASVVFEKISIPEPYLSFLTRARMYEIEQRMMEKKLDYLRREYVQMVELLGKEAASQIVLMREAKKEGARIYVIPRNDTSFVLKFYESVPGGEQKSSGVVENGEKEVR